jgi:hypothetical protein
MAPALRHCFIDMTLGDQRLDTMDEISRDYPLPTQIPDAFKKNCHCGD